MSSGRVGAIQPRLMAPWSIGNRLVQRRAWSQQRPSAFVSQASLAVESSGLATRLREIPEMVATGPGWSRDRSGSHGHHAQGHVKLFGQTDHDKRRRSLDGVLVESQPEFVAIATAIASHRARLMLSWAQAAALA